MKRILPRMLTLLFCLAATSALAQEATSPMSEEEAWGALPGYEYGQDMAPLLTIDRVVIRAMRTPEARSQLAARLAGLLEQPTTTRAAKQYICFKLRQVGTPREVPPLAEMFLSEQTSEMARYALESISGEESAAALRAGLDKLQGDNLVGTIQSLAARNDPKAVSRLTELAAAENTDVAGAALRALGTIAGPEAVNHLVARAQADEPPVDPRLEVPLLRAAQWLVDSNRQEAAKSVFELLNHPEHALGIRRGALEGLLALKGKQRNTTVIEWFTHQDALKRQVAAAHLEELSETELQCLSAGMADLDETGKTILLGILAAKQGQAVLPMVVDLLESNDRNAKLSGLRLIRLVGDPSIIPLLIESLALEGELGQAAQEALLAQPRSQVGPALIEALQVQPALRPSVIEALVRLKYYEAIDPLIKLAESDEAEIYEPALEGLRGIADPDPTDTPRLVKLLLKTPPGKRRDEVEKTILVVCEKQPADADRAAPVLAALQKLKPSNPKQYLPLLGRLGGESARKRIEEAMTSDDPELRDAAVRALCNWPNAKVADRLLQIATESENRAHGQWALRAYVRVVTLPNERPEATTLDMLQKAMELAERDEERVLIVNRASAVRTLDAVRWLSEFLDDPVLAQAACKSIVELAHHRFLRHPNMKQFDPILKRVAEVSEDPAVVERARRYRLGL